ncbi:MAG: hypothetical protein TREMPRED_004995 [Tremellales sp. Tagirdzhanova-0007]|nr:MAG: hypothetical protein TREMPRED_004995 [Tremellales sp. Tagirdzhanova-0007]
MALPPPSRLGRYRVLSPNCGLRISPLQLGAMSIGQANASSLGPITKEASFELLDTYYNLGGNYIDTANGYQMEESEEWIGEWLEKNGFREDMVIATKYTSNYKRGKQENHPISINRYKSMVGSLEASLKKLRTSYVDILYVHWWDWTTPIAEIMQGLNNFVKQGKVLYLGVSDTPAWVVSRANEYARNHGLAPFVIYQGRWSASSRDIERDILPMCLSEGMAIAPWGAIGQGRFQRKADIGKSKDGRSSGKLTEDEVKVSAALEQVADELKVENITAVALAYVMSKYPYVYPIVGGRKTEHLKGNVTALDIHLNSAQVNAIDRALPFDYGQPQSEFGMDPRRLGYQQQASLVSAGMIDFVPHHQPIDLSQARESDEKAAQAAEKA